MHPVDAVVLLCSETGRSSSDVARPARSDGLLGRFGCLFVLFAKEALHLIRDRWEEGRGDRLTIPTRGWRAHCTQAEKIESISTFEASGPPIHFKFDI